MLALTLAGCPRHMWIGRNPSEAASPSGPMDRCSACEVTPAPGGGNQYVCAPCEDSGEANAARFDRMLTAHFKLPACDGGLILDGLLIEDLQTPSPRVLYQCSPIPPVLVLDGGMDIP